jgi:hypothetical protein
LAAIETAVGRGGASDYPAFLRRPNRFWELEVSLFWEKCSMT